VIRLLRSGNSRLGDNDMSAVDHLERELIGDHDQSAPTGMHSQADRCPFHLPMAPGIHRSKARSRNGRRRSEQLLRDLQHYLAASVTRLIEFVSLPGFGQRQHFLDHGFDFPRIHECCEFGKQG
jgi:hypothetical protein